MAKRSRSAATVGVLFIVATVFFIIGDAVYGPVLRSDEFLARVSAERTRVFAGVLLGLVGILAIPLIATFLFPILRRESQAWAQSYMAIRIVEAVLLAVVSASTLSLIDLGEAHLDGGVGAPALSGAASALRALGEWAHIVSVGIVFPCSAIVLNSLLLRMRLVPRWIAHWGLWAAVLLLGGTSLAQLGVLSGVPDVALEIVLAGPIAVNEMVLAVWLIVKGFHDREESQGAAAV